MSKGFIGFLAALYLGIVSVWVMRIIPKNEVDPNLEFYYGMFLHAVQHNCSPNEYNRPNQISVKFAKLPDDEIGLCTRSVLSYKIEIDRDAWESMNENKRFQLMFHEGLHCLLYEDHTDNPDDIMYPYIRSFEMIKVFQQALAHIRSDCEMWRHK